MGMTAAQFEGWLDDPARPVLVMGILNVTPDSFSDGGKWDDPAAAAEAAMAMAAAGAHLVDIGGESTRPGAARLDAATQIGRIVPVLRALGGRVPAILSVDTTRAAVAEAAMDEGATIINDISGAMDDPGMLPLAARRAAGLILMHMQGQPATMQLEPRYGDVVAEVSEYLRQRLSAAVQAGVAARRVLLDPGIGFGKDLGHNLALLQDLRRLSRIGRPLVVGTSRKGFVGRITGEMDPARRVMGTAATVAWCVANGAAVVRVHDVEAMSQVVRMIEAITRGVA